MSDCLGHIQPLIDAADDEIKVCFEASLDQFSASSLKRVILENYQYSKVNPKFLYDSYKQTLNLKEQGIAKELLRNYNEELPHKALYEKALKQLNIDWETYVSYDPMAVYLSELERLIQKSPSHALGAIYYGEACAIYEMDRLRQVAVRLEQVSGESASTMIYFCDLHLGGVEQAHRDELAQFLRDSDRGDIDWSAVGTTVQDQIDTYKRLWIGLYTQLITV